MLYSIQLLFCLFLFYSIGYAVPCDYTCKTCRLVFVFTFCAQCTSDRYYNETTDKCQCMPYHTEINQVCESCPTFCYTCSSIKSCTSCLDSSFRQVKNGSCQCKDGYEENNSEQTCVKKSSPINYGLIIGSTLGAACFVLSICCCCMIYLRKMSSVKIYDQNTRKRRSVFIVNHRIERRQQSELIQNEQSINEKSSQLEKSQESIQFKTGQVCSICLDEDPLYMTQCGHYFHLKCISQWLEKKNKTCPNCNNRTKLKRLKKWCRKCFRNTIPYYQNSDYCEGCQGCEHVIIY